MISGNDKNKQLALLRQLNLKSFGIIASQEMYDYDITHHDWNYSDQGHTWKNKANVN